MSKTIKVIFIAFFMGVFCGSCIMNSTLSVFSNTEFQSPRDNEAGTLKNNKQEAEPEKDMDKKGVLPWLLDRTFGGGK